MAEQSGWVAHRCPQCGGTLPTTTGHVVCPFCGTHLTRVVEPSGEGQAAQPQAAPVKGIHLKPYTYMDAQGLGGEAFRLLIPAGWAFEGGIEWSMRVPSMPGAVAFRVRNPDGAEVLEAFPAMPFCWTSSPMMSMGFGGGMAGYEMQAPGPAGQVLQQVVLPRVRGQLQGLQFVSQQPLLGLPAQTPDPFTGAPTTDEGAKLRVRYRSGDEVIEEEMYRR